MSFLSNAVSIALIKFDYSHVVISNCKFFVILFNIFLALKAQVFDNFWIIFVILPFFYNFNFLNFSLLWNLYLLTEFNKILMHLFEIKLFLTLTNLLDKSDEFNFFNNILFLIENLIWFIILIYVSSKNWIDLYKIFLYLLQILAL